MRVGRRSGVPGCKSQVVQQAGHRLCRRAPRCGSAIIAITVLGILLTACGLDIVCSPVRPVIAVVPRLGPLAHLGAPVPIVLGHRTPGSGAERCGSRIDAVVNVAKRAHRRETNGSAWPFAVAPVWTLEVAPPRVGWWCV